MSRIQDLLKNEHDRKLDYDDLLKRFPWINEKARYCVLSPDSDGCLWQNTGIGKSSVFMMTNWRL